MQVGGKRREGREGELDNTSDHNDLLCLGLTMVSTNDADALLQN